MPFGAIIGAVAGLGGAAIGASATDNAVAAQTQAADQQIALQKQIFGITNRNEKPYLEAGNNGLKALLQGMGLVHENTPGVKFGSLDAPFTAADYHKSPGYNFQMQQGIQAVDNSASATGGVNSGNTLKALTQFGQGLANTDYQQAYNNYVANQNNLYGRFSNLAGSGQNAAAQLGGFGQNYAGAVGNSIGSIGNAQSAGYIANGNTLSNLLNNPSLQSSFQNMFSTGLQPISVNQLTNQPLQNQPIANI